MKKMLALAAAGEAALGLVLLVYPPIVVRLLFNAQIAGAGMVMSRVAGIALIALGVASLPGPPQVGMLTYSGGRHAVSRLRRLRREPDRPASLAGGALARDPGGTLDSGINKRSGDEEIKRMDRARPVLPETASI